MKTTDNLSGRTFRELIEAVLYAASSDTTRYHLNAVKLERDGNALLAIATDGHRLALERMADFELALPEGGLLISLDQIKALKKLLHRKGSVVHPMHVVVSPSAPKITVKVPGGEIELGMEGEFPNWRQVMPKAKKADESKPIEVMEDLRTSAKAIGDCSEKGMLKVALNRKHGMTLSVEQDIPGGKIDATANLEVKGLEYEFGLNARYLIDALDHMGRRHATLTVTDSLAPIMFKAGEMSTAVVMPVRL